jgi:hypothetical protein
VRVGTVQVVVPETEGPLTLDLSLMVGEVEATNRYETQVVPAD